MRGRRFLYRSCSMAQTPTARSLYKRLRETLWRFVACAGVWVLTGCSESPHLVHFSGLPPTDTLEVNFTSEGPNRHEVFRFEYRPGANPSMKVWVSEVDPDPKARGRVVEIPLGGVQLSERELSGLDKLLKFYRSGPSNACTITEKVVVIRKRGDRVLGKESFTDRSCTAWIISGLTRFPQIAEKAARALNRAAER